MELHGFWRSQASHRVRIALALKGLDYRAIPVTLYGPEPANRTAQYRTLNPQGLVPTLVDGRISISQSMAIIEYLDECYPEPPLMPDTVAGRALARQFAQMVVCDIQPMNNLRVLQYLRRTIGVDEEAKDRWYRHWILEGFDAIELWLTSLRHAGPYALGEAVTLADVCLVPQIEAARRFRINMDDFPQLAMLDEACAALTAFQVAAPQAQPEVD
mgnify:FL=1